MAEVTLTVEDRLDIRDLLARYAMALDTRNEDGFAAVFTPDGVFHTSSGGFFEKSEGLRQFIRNVKKRTAALDTMHFMQQLYIRPSPGGVMARSYWMVIDPIAKAPRAFAYSDDFCVKLDGRWHIKERTLSTWEAQALPWS